jgi:hypothetical protein
MSTGSPLCASLGGDDTLEEIAVRRSTHRTARVPRAFLGKGLCLVELRMRQQADWKSAVRRSALR